VFIVSGSTAFCSSTSLSLIYILVLLTNRVYRLKIYCFSFIDYIILDLYPCTLEQSCLSSLDLLLFAHRIHYPWFISLSSWTIVFIVSGSTVFCSSTSLSLIYILVLLNNCVYRLWIYCFLFIDFTILDLYPCPLD
jgi:hypothetical protein